MTYRNSAKKFMSEQKYKEKSRNWGNSWHSACSYRGKLKPAIASELIELFTKEGDIVLDPMGGVGTIPFEACLQGRIGISNDLSSLAYIVSHAKLSPPSLQKVEKELLKLKRYIDKHKNKFIDDEVVKRFGLNKTISEYFHKDTLLEILSARSYFSENKLNDEQALIMSSIMHILHGNRPYALSRNSHPLTPYAPTGDFIYKNLILHTKDKINRMFEAKDFMPWNKGFSYQSDINELPNKMKHKADIIITSPPFATSFRFYTQNWMRLWFSGWEEEDFKKANQLYFDEKQNKDMDIYYEYFESCANMLKKNGRMILHLGKTSKINMAEELINRSKEWFDLIYLGSEVVDKLENHGITDKGATTEHQFVFLVKKQINSF